MAAAVGAIVIEKRKGARSAVVVVVVELSPALKETNETRQAARQGQECGLLDNVTGRRMVSHQHQSGNPDDCLSTGRILKGALVRIIKLCGR